MFVFAQDRQDVGETESTVVEIFNTGPVVCQFELTNDGANTLQYRFQEWVETAWADLDDSGTDLYNSLAAGESVTVNITAEEARVRLAGSASGGTVADFTVSRTYTRTSGGTVPLLSL